MSSYIPRVYDLIASNSYHFPIWVLVVGADLTDYLSVAYLLAEILRDIFISDDLECFRPGDALFFGSVIPCTNALAETA